jgi:hypothetical protein
MREIGKAKSEEDKDWERKRITQRHRGHRGCAEEGDERWERTDSARVMQLAGMAAENHAQDYHECIGFVQ